MNLNSNYFRYLCQFVRSLSHSVFYTLLVTSLVYTSLPIPRAFAAGRIDKGEVQSSLEVAQDYLDMVKHFEGILDGRPMDRHPLDTFSLLQQKAHLALDGSTRLVPWMNLDVSIRTFDEEKELFSTTMKANGNFKPGHGSETYYCRTSSPCRLTLSTEKLGTLNEFFFPAKAMTTFGPYVLFIKEHSFDSGKGTQTLSFVDLEGLSSLIGNEDIPVYDIELKMDQPLKEMKVVDGAIELNGDGLKLYPYQLADVSKIMYAAYNVKSNLVNPSTFNGALAQVDNFAHFMDQMAEITIEEEAREAHRAQRVVVDFARLKESLVADHRLQKTREEPRMAMDEKLASQNTHGRKVVGNAANVLASADAEEFLSESQKEMVKEFVTKLEENRQLDSALLGSQEKLLAGKKTFASFKRWVMYLMTPRPSRSNVIKNAIASIMTRIKMLGVKAHTEVYASGGLNLSAQVQLSVSQMSYRATKIVEWFSGRPLSTASMIGAGFLGVMFPEIYTATMEAGLAFGQGVVNYVNSALTGTYSAVIEGGGPVMEVLNPLRTIPVIDQAYVEGTKWTRTIIGVSGWLTVIAGILGLYHVSQNVVRLGLAMKKPGYEGFVPKMEKMVKQYNDSLAKAEAERLRMVSDKAKDFENRHPEEVKRLNEAAHKRIEEVKAMKDQAMKSSVVYKVFHPIMWTLKASGNAIVGLGKVTFGTVFRKLLGADSQRFFTALRVFIFSFASYTRTSLDYAAAW
ncbi:MAG: hypothetical protein KDD61_07220, partial [Bdellovibrionales bacterium]|nr:hypothetical protein [Bdellovibrionales bacterium]